MRKAQLYIFIWTFLLGVLTPIVPTFAACNGATPSCSSLSSSCKGTQALQGSASAKMDINCLLNNSSGSCFDQVPMSGGSGNYNSIGKRSPSRNHYGTDIGAGGRTGLTARAPADGGEIVYARLAGGSGPTIAINYKKKCSGGGDGPEGGYHVVFRHLCQIYKSSGTVNKGTEVGLVGGGNTVGGKACQNPAQKDKCPTNCSSGWYDIHLHFELLDGELCGGCGTQATPSKVIAPYCKDAAVLCGGCAAEKSCECVSHCGGAFGGDGSAGTNVTDTEQEGGEVGIDTVKSCELAQFLDTSSCVFCDIFKVIFNTSSELALTAINNLAIPCRNLVITGFLIWMLLYVLKQISTFSATSTGEMIKGLVYQGFRVAVVVLILNGAIFQVMNLTLNPVMMTGLNFATSLNTNSTCDPSASYMQDLKGYEGDYSEGNISGGLPINIGKSIVCSIKNMEDGVGILMGLGNYSICLAHNKHRFALGIFPGVGYLTTGWFLWIIGGILMLSFPWCLIDCVLQLCIAAALIPCAIAVFAFKITQKYMKIVWNFFMNAMFNFVFMAIIVYIINSNLLTWLGLGDIQNGNFNIPDQAFVKTGIVAPDNILPEDIDPTNAKNFPHMEGIAWWGSAAFKVLGICFLCWTFFDEAASMAKRFADSAGLGGKKGIAPMVGGDIAQGAKNYLGDPAMHYAGSGARAMGRGINSFAGNGFRSGLNHWKGRGMNMLSKLGVADSQITKRDPLTNKPLEYKSKIRLFGHDIERTVSKGENGWTSDKTSHSRTAVDKAFEAVRDKDGNIVKDENGHTKYVSRQRMFGMVTDYEEMTSSVDANGNIHYETADGSRSFTMNKDGEILSYKTPFTRTLFGESREKTDRQKYGTTRTIRDGLSKTVKQLDSTGKEIGSKTTYLNTSSVDLIEKDGTINANAFNQIKNGSENIESAATYMVAQVMKSRGMELSDSYVDRKVHLNDDGSFTITQKSKIGEDKKHNPVYSRQIITAQIVGNQMVLNVTSQNSQGDIVINRSNGMQSKVTRYDVQIDENGNKVQDSNGRLVYDRKERLDFSDYLNKRNSGRGVLNTNGQWGNRADRDKIMVGFTQEDYDKHLAQLQLRELQRTMTKAKYNELLQTPGSQVNLLNSLLRQKAVSQAEIMALHASAASLLGIQMPNPNPTPIPDPGPGPTPITDPTPEQTPNPDERTPSEDKQQQQREADEKAKAEEEKRQREADERAKAEEEKRQREADEKAKAEEERTQREAEEKAKAEQEKRQREAEEKAKAEKAKEKHERLQDEYNQLGAEKARLEKERDEITKQFADVNAQLAAAKDAMNAAGITDAEKRERRAAYNELLRQSTLLGEQLRQMRKDSNGKIDDYNQRVGKHNDEIPDKRLK